MKVFENPAEKETREIINAIEKAATLEELKSVIEQTVPSFIINGITYTATSINRAIDRVYMVYDKSTPEPIPQSQRQDSYVDFADIPDFNKPALDWFMVRSNLSSVPEEYGIRDAVDRILQKESDRNYSFLEEQINNVQTWHDLILVFNKIDCIVIAPATEGGIGESGATYSGVGMIAELSSIKSVDDIFSLFPNTFNLQKKMAELFEEFGNPDKKAIFDFFRENQVTPKTEPFSSLDPQHIKLHKEEDSLLREKQKEETAALTAFLQDRWKHNSDTIRDEKGLHPEAERLYMKWQNAKQRGDKSAEIEAEWEIRASISRVDKEKK